MNSNITQSQFYTKLDNQITKHVFFKKKLINTFFLMLTRFYLRE